MIHLVSALWIKEEGSQSTPSQEWFTQCGTPTRRSIRNASRSGSRNVSAVYASSSHICHVPPRGLLSAAVWLGPSAPQYRAFQFRLLCCGQLHSSLVLFLRTRMPFNQPFTYRSHEFISWLKCSAPCSTLPGRGSHLHYLTINGLSRVLYNPQDFFWR